MRLGASISAFPRSNRSHTPSLSVRDELLYDRARGGAGGVTGGRDEWM